MEILDRGFVKLSMESVARSATVRNDGVLFEAFFTKPLYRSLCTKSLVRLLADGLSRSSLRKFSLEMFFFYKKKVN